MQPSRRDAMVKTDNWTAVFVGEPQSSTKKCLNEWPFSRTFSRSLLLGKGRLDAVMKSGEKFLRCFHNMVFFSFVPYCKFWFFPGYPHRPFVLVKDSHLDLDWLGRDFFLGLALILLSRPPAVHRRLVGLGNLDAFFPGHRDFHDNLGFIRIIDHGVSSPS